MQLKQILRGFLKDYVFWVTLLSVGFFPVFIFWSEFERGRNQEYLEKKAFPIKLYRVKNEKLHNFLHGGGTYVTGFAGENFFQNQEGVFVEKDLGPQATALQLGVLPKGKVLVQSLENEKDIKIVDVSSLEKMNKEG
ncbi:MAG TPA: hypothetical protein VI959_00560 [Alphaproteobacteria bacterium]|nr:hypothetical protein [Alphaproteobacteria bacterium]